MGEWLIIRVGQWCSADASQIYLRTTSARGGVNPTVAPLWFGSLASERHRAPGILDLACHVVTGDATLVVHFDVTNWHCNHQRKCKVVAITADAVDVDGSPHAVIDTGIVRAVSGDDQRRMLQTSRSIDAQRPFSGEFISLCDSPSQ